MINAKEALANYTSYQLSQVQKALEAFSKEIEDYSMRTNRCLIPRRIDEIFIHEDNDLSIVGKKFVDELIKHGYNVYDLYNDGEHELVCSWGELGDR